MRHLSPRQNRLMKRRARVLAVLLAVVCFGGLLVRLFILQLLDPGGYAARAADQQLRGATLPAARGEILSADGTLLAASETCWTIRAAPRELADELVEPAARALSEILEIDYEETLEKFSQRTSNDCLLRRRVDREMADAVRDWCQENGAQGIQIRQDTKRVYPQGDFMGGILGFTDVDNAGLWGLELQYNEELTGSNGEILTAKNAWGYDMPTHYQTLVEAVPGNTLTLTIDANIQHWLESAMDAAVREHNVAQRGVGIVMDVQTGAILAMTSQPDYDPNTPREIINEEVREQVNALTGEARSAALQQAQQTQWRNKAISDLYEPGSVFKLITRPPHWIAVCARRKILLSVPVKSMWREPGFAVPMVISMAWKPLPRVWQPAVTPALSRSVPGWARKISATISRLLVFGKLPGSTCPARSNAANIIPPTGWGRCGILDHAICTFYRT